MTATTLKEEVFASATARWNAVCNRDSNADGAFIFAVKTTGIYRRPSCTARRPLQKNVRFFDNSHQARLNGFRSCKRCRPDEIMRAHPYSSQVEKACRLIETLETAPSLAELSKEANLTPSHFQRVFKTLVGLSPKQYEKAVREAKFRKEVSSADSVTSAMFDAGYQSSGRFYCDAMAVTGMAPSTRKLKGRGEKIRLAVSQCSLGSLLVATSEHGICSIALGDDIVPLLSEFEADFANATITAGDKDFENLVTAVIHLIEEPTQPVVLPLDIRGTVFQKKVWNALAAIPPGQTTNYAAIAKAIGQPTAARAVANACGQNRLAVAIPCHRVVRNDGRLSGYRWGGERKAKLLARETSHG